MWFLFIQILLYHPKATLSYISRTEPWCEFWRLLTHVFAVLGPNRFRRGFGQQQNNRRQFRNALPGPRRRAAAALSGVSPLNRPASAQEVWEERSTALPNHHVVLGWVFWSSITPKDNLHKKCTATVFYVPMYSICMHRWARMHACKAAVFPLVL